VRDSGRVGMEQQVLELPGGGWSAATSTDGERGDLDAPAVVPAPVLPASLLLSDVRDGWWRRGEGAGTARQRRGCNTPGC
jgi:hypothetical protein